MEPVVFLASPQTGVMNRFNQIIWIRGASGQSTICLCPRTNKSRLSRKILKPLLFLEQTFGPAVSMRQDKKRMQSEKFLLNQFDKEHKVNFSWGRNSSLTSRKTDCEHTPDRQSYLLVSSMSKARSGTKSNRKRNPSAACLHFNIKYYRIEHGLTHGFQRVHHPCNSFVIITGLDMMTIALWKIGFKWNKISLMLFKIHIYTHRVTYIIYSNNINVKPVKWPIM